MIAREVIVYAFGAGLAFAVDFAVLATLVEVAGIHYLVAATLGFLAGTAVVYWIAVHYAFSFRKVADARAEFGVFATIGAFGVLLNLGCMYAAVDWFGLHYAVGKILSGGFTFVANYALRRLILFTPPRRAPTLSK